MNTKTNIANDELQSLLEVGVTEATISEITDFFQQEHVWIYRIKWVDDQTPVLRLACPRCGDEADYHLDAVTDFDCPDDQDCGYDWTDPEETQKPLLA